MTRRRFWIAAGGLAAAGAAYPFAVEPNWFQVTKKIVPLRGINACSRLRILHLSDFHASTEMPMSRVERAIRLGIETQPDLICLTGDYVTRGMEVDAEGYRKLLGRLASAAPVLASFGNHDGGRWAKAGSGYASTNEMQALLESVGIAVLRNRSMQVNAGAQAITVVGVGDLWAADLQAEPAFRGVSAESAPVVLLSHNPDSKAEVKSYPWRLMLCGHTHGGQVALPGYGPLMVPVNDRAYAAGLNRWDNRWIHTTRGVGGLMRGVRFLCRPEISVLDLVPENWEACTYDPDRKPGD